MAIRKVYFNHDNVDESIEIWPYWEGHLSIHACRDTSFPAHNTTVLKFDEQTAREFLKEFSEAVNEMWPEEKTRTKNG